MSAESLGILAGRACPLGVSALENIDKSDVTWFHLDMHTSPAISRV